MWPDGLLYDAREQLCFEGCPLEALASEFGTPLYVISARNLVDGAKRLCDLAAGCSSKTAVTYSFKANTLPHVCRVLAGNALGAEVSSVMEMRLALNLGYQPATIVFNAPMKSEEDIRLALRNEIGFVNISSDDELARLNRIARETRKGAAVGLRVGLPSAKMLLGRPSRFGVDIENGLALQFLRQSRQYEYVRITGLHFHLGTQIWSSAPYVNAISEAIGLLLQALEEGLMELQYFDIGGGFGVAPSSARPEVEEYFRTQIEPDLVQGILHHVSDVLEYNRLSPLVIVEPGRLLVAKSGLLLTRVVGEQTHKEISGFLVDAGQSMVASNLQLKIFHDLVPVRRKPEAREVPTNIFGCLCYESDVIALGLPLPPLESGDLLAVLDCGAYDISFSVPFILPRPPVILVKDGDALLARNRDGIAVENLSNL